MAVLEFVQAVQTSVIASPAFLLLSSAAIIVSILLRLADRPGFKSKSPPLATDNLPIIGAFGFFSRRWDFIQQHGRQSGSGNFSFHAGKYPLIGLTGHANRRLFFHSGQLDFNAGYEVLFDNGPKVEDDKNDEKLGARGFGNFFRRSVKHVLRQERLREKIDIIKDATRTGLAELGSDGRMEPFEHIYNLIYRMTMLLVGCNEIARDKDLLAKSMSLFQIIDSSSTPASIIAPWAPLPALLRRNIAGARLYMMFDKFIKDRKKTGRREDDTLQILMDQDVETVNILKFVLGAVFAGLLNTGINSAALVCYLANNAKWRELCIEDMRRVCRESGCDTSKPLVDQLGQLPIEVWEQGIPAIDVCLKESMRLQLLGSFFRRNISGSDVLIKQPDGSEEIIPDGAFAVYHVADVHQNPDIYPNPMQYDPDRYTPGREEHLKAPHAWVGWGAGLHPCLGIRTAKLEIMVLISHFLAMFDWKLLDAAGQPTQMPDPDLNAHTAVKPTKKLVVEYQRVEKH